MGPDLALAIDACVSEASASVIVIIKKINEVRKFKGKCKKLGSEAYILNQLLEKNKSAIESLETLQAFKSCIDDINKFVDDACQDFTWIDSGIDVLWSHEYRSLRKRIVALKDVFILESVTQILTREDNIIQNQQQLLKEQRSQSAILNDLQKAAKAQELERRVLLLGVTLPSIKVDIVLRDPSILTFDVPDKSIGHGNLENLGAVVCYQINLSNRTQEHLRIYRDIQAGAYVQRLYGTLEADGYYYAVMQDLDHEMTLGEACRDGTLPEGILARTSLAYDLAKTMAWYHRAELLLKSVADHTVILKRLPSGRTAPFLTRLENIRHMLEQTTGTVYDSRYEAPEFDKLRQHTMFTDVWSLGTVIWQCVSGETPYQIDVSVLADDEKFPDVRRMLDAGQWPGRLKDDEWPESLVGVIRQCWDRDPLLRPTAAAVASALLSVLTTVPLLSSVPTDTGLEMMVFDDANEELLLQDARKEALQAIKEARQSQTYMKDVNPPTQVAQANIKLPDDKQFNRKKLPKEKFRLLIDEGDYSRSTDSFLVGALIWWNLSDGVEEEKPIVTPLATTEEGRRAELALAYLKVAAQNGCHEAYCELYKAYAALAREFRDCWKAYSK